MNTEEAEKKLRDHGYIVIPSRTRKSFEVRRPDQNGIPLYLPSGKRGRKVMYELNRLSPRELIRMAKSYTSDSPGRTAFKKPLKEYQAKRDRRKTKQAIRHQNIDSIPLDKPLHEENRWNWD
jgi:bifunctional DNA-binding transcriptional regulator/antitoxin component of YhaV-PrlF toxin-antitoxin module